VRLAAAHASTDPVPAEGGAEVYGIRFAYLRLRERLRDRARYALRVVMRPTIADARWHRLPYRLRGIYLPARWLRLARNGLRSGAR
jgi:hypothetical protein